MSAPAIATGTGSVVSPSGFEAQVLIDGWAEKGDAMVEELGAVGHAMAVFGVANVVTVPLVGKRGYHVHFRAEGNATLTRPVLDTEFGGSAHDADGNLAAIGD